VRRGPAGKRRWARLCAVGYSRRRRETHVALVADGVEPAVEVVHVARETIDEEIPGGGGENRFRKQADRHFNGHNLAVFDETGEKNGVRLQRRQAADGWWANELIICPCSEPDATYCSVRTSARTQRQRDLPPLSTSRRRSGAVNCYNFSFN
jgi:hypothetical protein